MKSGGRRSNAMMFWHHKNEGMLHGVLGLPHISGSGIPEKGFQDIRGYRLNRFFECDDNSYVACNTFSIQSHKPLRRSICRKCPHSLLKMEMLQL